MIAAVLALETFADRLRGADILLLIDSEAVVEGSRIKGYSSSEDLCELISCFSVESSSFYRSNFN